MRETVTVTWKPAEKEKRKMVENKREDENGRGDGRREKKILRRDLLKRESRITCLRLTGWRRGREWERETESARQASWGNKWKAAAQEK